MEAKLKKAHDNAEKAGDRDSPNFWLYLFWNDMFMTDEQKYLIFFLIDSTVTAIANHMCTFPS
jgi:hypothetical protein